MSSKRHQKMDVQDQALSHYLDSLLTETNDTTAESAPQVLAQEAEVPKPHLEREMKPTLEAQPKPVLNTKYEAKPKPILDTKLEAEPKPILDTKLEAEPKPILGTKLEAESKPILDTKLEAKPKPMLDTKPKVEPKPKLETKLEAKPTLKPKPKAEPKLNTKLDRPYISIHPIQPPVHRSYHLLIIISMLMIIGANLSDATQSLLNYDRAAIINGELWRIITGHFMHLGTSHLLMNLAGMLLIWLLFGHHLSTVRWWVVIFTGALCVSAGLFFLNSQLLWYVGLSGILHTLFISGALTAVMKGYRMEIFLLLMIVAKLGWEQLYGALPGSSDIAGGSVIVDAHLYGALAGVLISVVFSFLPVRSS